eukprot:CAMPEP_0197001444 /NCGR_PEP_ID=MMETSP1380-20130617/6147_1 /TAXON_ID=5936 /ORGANISM="Euplotes crassus, Strain CT5" /LENGTH=340 /DNA_ID=CAMNT_0042419123 /DNA_START=1 /DNA_END=1019 /DNA_ORIENTATION=+
MILSVLEELKGQENDPLNERERMELDALRNENEYLQAKLSRLEGNTIQYEEDEESKQDTHRKHYPDDSETESSDEEEEDSVAPLPQPKKGVDRKPRTSVSAEAFGVWNKKSDFKPVVVTKNESTKDKIRSRLSQSFLFNSLDEKEFEIVIDAMTEVKLNPGECIIKEGDDGDYLYVVETGQLQCSKIFPGNTEPTNLIVYNPGGAFGELALLYNAPRAATITAIDECLLWGLDRKTFNHIVKDAAVRKREMYDEFLKKVKILQTMDAYERQTVADAFSKHKYSQGDLIIKEGEDGDELYFLVEGEAQATKNIDGELKKVMEYKAGDYFGERALIKKEPRA